jgi:hypothetical protein
MDSISSIGPFSIGDLSQAQERINNLFENEEASSSQLMDDIRSNRTSFVLPSDSEDRAYFLDLFEKLLSRPLSKRLVNEIANSGKRIDLQNGLENKFHQKRWIMKAGFTFRKPLTERVVHLNIKSENKEHGAAVIVKRAEHYFQLWNFERQRAMTLEFSPTFISFAHELIHAYHSINNKNLSHLPANEKVYTNLEEENTIKGVLGYSDYTENAIRAEFGLRERYSHQGVLARLDHRRGPGKVMVA